MLQYRSQSILIERDGGENPIENKEKRWENRWSGCKKVKLGRRNLLLCGSTSFSSHSLLRGVALNPSIKLNKKNEGWILQDVMCFAEARGSMMIRCRLGAGGALSRLCRGTSLQTLSLVLLVLVVVCRPCHRVNHLDHYDYQKRHLRHHFPQKSSAVCFSIWPLINNLETTVWQTTGAQGESPEQSGKEWVIL